jgi:hypothetical protein
MILFITSSFSIHSQTTYSFDNQGRFVSYEKLNEFAKYVAFKSYADSLITDYKKELNQAYTLLGIKDRKINELEYGLIPQLNLEIELLESQRKDDKILSNKIQEKHKGEIISLKKSVFKWSGITTLFGIIIGILISNG